MKIKISYMRGCQKITGRTIQIENWYDLNSELFKDDIRMLKKRGFVITTNHKKNRDFKEAIFQRI